jgi:glycosyltransferase involved in cell wall biosynthesis
MNKVINKEKSLFLSFRKNRLIGLIIGLLGGLSIAIGLAPLTSFIYDFLYKFSGSFFTALIIVPYSVIALGIYWYFKTEETGFKVSKMAEEAYISAQKIHREKPEKTKPVWDMAQLTIEIYFNRNLNQIRWIFWLSIAVMSLGFLLILYGVALGYQNPKENWSIAGIGGLSGIITEFIGATFLFVYKSSIQQANKYTEILERMNFVGMAMQMLDSVNEENKISEQSLHEKSIDSLRDAKIEMAKALLTKLQTVSNKDKTD